MLEGLQTIDWASLTHAYGPAEDVPDMICGLVSTDPEVWVAAIDGLYATLCHQTCTVYPATVPAIPFLIELLGYKEIRCRGRVLQFLGDAARATSYLAAHGHMSHYDKERATEEFQGQLAEELVWVRATREAIWNGFDMYLDLLTDFDKRLRIIIPYTLGLLVQFAGQEMPQAIRQRDPCRIMTERFRRQMDEEPNELVRASLVFGLATLANDHVPVANVLERIAEDQTASKLIRVSAAYCLAGLNARPSPVVAEILFDALKHPDGTNHLFDSDQPGMEDKHHPLYKGYRQAGLPLDERSGTGFDADDVGKDEGFSFPWECRGVFSILERVSQIELDDVDRKLPVVTPYLDNATPYTGETVATPILRMVFKDRKVTPQFKRTDLTDAQAEVLKHLYDNLRLWATSISNTSGAFIRFGLSEYRKDWTRLLGIEEKPLSDDEIEGILKKVVPPQQYDFDGPTIKRINLRQIGTSAFLPHLRQFPDLECLDLSSVPLTDADMKHVVCFSKLKKLHIPGAQVTDVGAALLATMLALEELNVAKTRITKDGLALLRESLPNCSIWQ